ncbi:merozoite surface protein 6, putative [Plasmodium sp. gorilla clade G2]|uniref:merozoite surface protein 6, putative n=1 Tax=Plasmodium sp. gorilla clade G2 TaxID=880535 RepID=UPI000D20F814|nr:merozoite surface protein 6, putative [Plasmodium sp. gorilla clade G2]SOV15231.1 merozoite surface protein 6, putative [Plasmodium sp. gorilla clade G2]
MYSLFNIIFGLFFIHLCVYKNNIVINEIINESNNNLRSSITNNGNKNIQYDLQNININYKDSNDEKNENITEKEIDVDSVEENDVEKTPFVQNLNEDSEIPLEGDDIQATYVFGPESRKDHFLHGSNKLIPPTTRLSGEEGDLFSTIIQHKRFPPIKKGPTILPQISGRSDFKGYAGESGENRYIGTSGPNSQTTGKEKVTSGTTTRAQSKPKLDSEKNSPKTSPYDNMLGWEFGGGAPKNGAAEDKKTKHLLEQIKIPSWDRDNIPDENEQVKEDPQVGNIYEEEETEDLETEDDENEEIEENEKDEVDEEDGEEMEEKTKEEKQDNKIIDESKEEQNNNSSSDINAQNLISNEHKKNNEAKKTSENIVKTLIELFNEKNEIDSTINNLVQEMVELFSNN